MFILNLQPNHHLEQHDQDLDPYKKFTDPVPMHERLTDPALNTAF
jgi:hypothetical protein